MSIFEFASGRNGEALVAHARALMHAAFRDDPGRIAHSEGVCRAARRTVFWPEYRHAAEVLGLLHDIGHAVPSTGIPGIDAARAVDGTVLAPFAPYLAWHATSAWEVAERGEKIEYAFPGEGVLTDALWVADFAVDSSGKDEARDEGDGRRYAQVHYPAQDAPWPVIQESLPYLRGARERVALRAAVERRP